jgi:hypothetical protein
VFAHDREQRALERRRVLAARAEEQRRQAPMRLRAGKREFGLQWKGRGHDRHFAPVTPGRP